MTKRSEQQLPEQILLTIQYADRILAEGEEVAAVFKQLNVTEAAYYRWRNHYRELNAEDAKNLKQLERQNLQLKTLLAEQVAVIARRLDPKRLCWPVCPSETGDSHKCGPKTESQFLGKTPVLT